MSNLYRGPSIDASKDIYSRKDSNLVFSRFISRGKVGFSALYTTLPHDKLKTRLKETIHKASVIETMAQKLLS
jgi:hypothetical protein